MGYFGQFRRRFITQQDQGLTMDTVVRVRRTRGLHLEPVDRAKIDVAAMLAGGRFLDIQHHWQGLAPETGRKVVVEAADLATLLSIGEADWTAWSEAVALVGAPALQRLVDAGLLEVTGSSTPPDAERLRDEQQQFWHPLNRLLHAFSRWSRADPEANRRQARFDAVEDMVRRCGLPPPHFHRRADAVARAVLDEPERTPIDDLLERRATCRNFDLSWAVPTAQMSALLKRVFGVHGSEAWAPGAVALKKNHPSGGALHPTEAYLVVQRAEGLAPGLYHYNVEAHSLDMLRELSAGEARSQALTAVAGQDYFAEAPVLVVMAARFARSMWKYRNHPKIYRAILLEMGHISQNLYLTATEMNLGAFITAAINEVEIEQAFGLEPMAEGPLAVCGFGARAAERVTVEFDPGHKVWRDG
ncbi:MAG TPA: putative peptide maturation dehydrogenase [Rhodanobacteraceae bacterium]|nr:putative peptide maturation dehydrogenase [Rhodanobacteraceae bacterium]